MGRRKFQLSENEIHQLQQHLENAANHFTYTRLQAVLWYGTGLPIEHIQTRLDCSRSSILGWCQEYCTSGPGGLTSRWQGGNNARLTSAQVADLCARMQAHTPGELFGRHAATRGGSQWTLEDLHRAIRLWYGVVYRSRSSYYRLLKRCLEAGI